LVSTDCGANWSNVYAKQGSTLSTAPAYSAAAFVPSATQWRTETINLSSLGNQPSVLIKFRATADFGNNLYIDNINLGQPPPPTSVAKIDRTNVACELFPNPTSGLTTVSIRLSKNETVGIVILNSIGQTVYTSKNNHLSSGVNNISLNVEDWAPGVYFVNVSTQNDIVNMKLNVSK
jgi:hypothetical protein